jgi:photosystem II stability/assembly factor-like uncharacterized protein
LSFTLFFVVTSCRDNQPTPENQQTNSTNSVSEQANRPVIYLSADAGNTWRAYSSGIPGDATISAFLIDHSTIYAATNSHGIYSIRERADKWTRIDTNLPKNIKINAIASAGKTLLIGSNKNGIFTSENDGQTWKSASVKVGKTSVRNLFFFENVVFAATDDGIYQSSDSGKSWKQSLKSSQINGFTKIDHTIYAAAVDGALMSTDVGKSWKYIYKALTLHDISTDGKNIYAMTMGDGLLKSGDNGTNWENINNGLDVQKLYTFEIKAVNNVLYAGQWHGIYKLKPGDLSWSKVQNGLPESTSFTTLESFGTNLIAGAVSLRLR